jgi:hypothetical protein
MKGHKAYSTALRMMITEVMVMHLGFLELSKDLRYASQLRHRKHMVALALTL